MKKSLLYCVLCCSLFASFTTFAQSWEWAVNATGASGTNGNEPIDIATDPRGNVYMLGSFECDTVTFGSITLSNNDTSIWPSDLAFVKYSPAGNVVWAKHLCDCPNVHGSSLACDAAGNVYVTGSFGNSTITFGSITLTNVGWGDAFLVKYDSSGSAVWAKSAGGTSSDVANHVTTDQAGNVYLTGTFESASFAIGSYTLTNTGNVAVFTAKYDSAGNVLWAQCTGGGQEEYSQALAVDTWGNVYVAGGFSSVTMAIGPYILTNADTTSTNNDLFLVKYDAAGNLLWARRDGGRLTELSMSLTTDPSGNVYETGLFSDSVITFGGTTLNSAGYYNSFLVKYDPSGNPLWAKNAGDSVLARGAFVTADAAGNIYLDGNFASPATFGATTLNNGGSWDIFLVKYNEAGDVQWAKSVGGPGYEFSWNIAIDPAGDIYLAGAAESHMLTFGATTITNTDTITDNIFLAKFGIPAGVPVLNTSEESVFIFPNPATTLLTISAPANITSIVITNLLGQTVYSSTLAVGSLQASVDVSMLTGGVYLVRVNPSAGSGQAVVRKFVKQ